MRPERRVKAKDVKELWAGLLIIAIVAVSVILLMVTAGNMPQ